MNWVWISSYIPGLTGQRIDFTDQGISVLMPFGQTDVEVLPQSDDYYDRYCKA